MGLLRWASLLLLASCYDPVLDRDERDAAVAPPPVDAEVCDAHAQPEGPDAAPDDDEDDDHDDDDHDDDTDEGPGNGNGNGNGHGNGHGHGHGND